MNTQEFTTLAIDTVSAIADDQCVTFDHWVKLGEAALKVGVKGRKSATDAVAERLDLGMTRASFTSRLGEAMDIVKAWGGTADSAGDKLNALNVERTEAGKRAIYSVQTVAKMVRPSAARTVTDSSAVARKLATDLAAIDDIATLETLEMAIAARIAMLRPTLVTDQAA